MLLNLMNGVGMNEFRWKIVMIVSVKLIFLCRFGVWKICVIVLNMMFLGRWVEWYLFDGIVGCYDFLFSRVGDFVDCNVQFNCNVVVVEYFDFFVFVNGIFGYQVVDGYIVVFWVEFGQMFQVDDLIFDLEWVFEVVQFGCMYY